MPFLSSPPSLRAIFVFYLKHVSLFSRAVKIKHRDAHKPFFQPRGRKPTTTPNITVQNFLCACGPSCQYLSPILCILSTFLLSALSPLDASFIRGSKKDIPRLGAGCALVSHNSLCFYRISIPTATAPYRTLGFRNVQPGRTRHDHKPSLWLPEVLQRGIGAQIDDREFE